MNRNLKKGFTLIEVLAILVVLALLAVITVPMITKTINTAREGVAQSNANSYVSEVEQEIYRRTILGDTLADGQYTVAELTSEGIEVNGTKPSDDGIVIIVNQAVVGYSLTMDGILVTKEYTGEIPVSLPKNEVNEIDVVRGEDTVHITNSSELQDGDVYVNGQYEYHYNAVYAFSHVTYEYEWDNDTSLNGWAMKLTDDSLDDEEITTKMVTKIMNKNIVTMEELFSNSSAERIDLSSFDTSKVTNMSEMFNGCSNLTSIDVSRFDTSKVTNMSEMFSYCSSLTSLDLSGFKTANVTDMSLMFADCSGLTDLRLPANFINDGADTNYMFCGCSNLERSPVPSAIPDEDWSVDSCVA